jgi:membrane-associated HD superfamily phosphohydrolase
MAVLMLADCCEAASRSAAQHNRNLSRQRLEDIVRSLIAERVADGQLDSSSLTFADLKTVTASFIDTLVGVYHPRIAYPDPVAPTLDPESVEP